MTKHCIGFIVVLLLMFEVRILAQVKYVYNLPKKTIYSQLFLTCLTQTYAPCESVIPIKAVKFTQPVPANFYTRFLGVFCRKELQLERFLMVPIRIGIGSLEYTIWMERKPNTFLHR